MSIAPLLALHRLGLTKIGAYTTVLNMTREAYKTVTPIPILMPAIGQESDGQANFDLSRPVSTKVRMFADDDLAKLKKLLPANNWKFLSGVLGVKQAFESKDQLKLRQGYADVAPVMLGKSASNVEMQLQKEFLDALAVDARSAVIFLPQLATYALKDARLVLWRSKGKFVPAIFCPNFTTALYTKALLGRIKVCPHCNQLFEVPRSNQDYCSIAHREAHRVARWRAGKEQLKASQKKDGRSGKKSRRART
jgi:hypothetical protein